MYNKNEKKIKSFINISPFIHNFQNKCINAGIKFRHIIDIRGTRNENIYVPYYTLSSQRARNPALTTWRNLEEHQMWWESATDLAAVYNSFLIHIS